MALIPKAPDTRTIAERARDSIAQAFDQTEAFIKTGRQQQIQTLYKTTEKVPGVVNVENPLLSTRDTQRAVPAADIVATLPPAVARRLFLADIQIRILQALHAADEGETVEARTGAMIVGFLGTSPLPAGTTATFLDDAGQPVDLGPAVQAWLTALGSIKSVSVAAA